MIGEKVLKFYEAYTGIKSKHLFRSIAIWEDCINKDIIDFIEAYFQTDKFISPIVFIYDMLISRAEKYLGSEIKNCFEINEDLVCIKDYKLLVKLLKEYALQKNIDIGIVDEKRKISLLDQILIVLFDNIATIDEDVINLLKNLDIRIKYNEK